MDMKKAEQDPVVAGLIELHAPVIEEQGDRVLGGGEYAAYAGVTLSLGATNLFFANCRPGEVIECYTSTANLFPLVGGTALTLVGLASLGATGYKTIQKRHHAHDHEGVGDELLR